MNIMKKNQKRLLIWIAIVPAIILTISFLITGISIKDLPWWAIIIPILLIATPFSFIFGQLNAQRIYNAPLQEKKKKILIAWSVYNILIAIILIIIYCVRYHLFWITFIQLVFVSFLIFFGNFRLFFLKKKKTPENDNQNKYGV